MGCDWGDKESSLLTQQPVQYMWTYSRYNQYIHAVQQKTQTWRWNDAAQNSFNSPRNSNCLLLFFNVPKQPPAPRGLFFESKNYETPS